MGDSICFTIDINNYKSAGLHKSQHPEEVSDIIRAYNLVIVFMEFSISSTLIKIVRAKNSITRVAGLHPEKKNGKWSF